MTGRFVYEPTHPWISRAHVFLVKKWTRIHSREDLPEDYTMFNIEFFLDHREVDDFCCLSDLATEATLELSCIFKTVPRPGARVCKSFGEAIGNHQPKLLYSLLSKYRMPSLLRVGRGEMVNPLTLLLQSP